MPDTPLDTGDQTNTAVLATLPLDEAAFVRLAREAYSASTSYFDTAIRRGVIDDLRQFQGQHPQGSKYLSDAYRARSKFFRPKTRSAVRKNEAISAEAFFSTMDVLSVKAMDDDDKVQRASAEIAKELVQYRLEHSIPWFLLAQGAYQDAQVQGVVCSYQYWEYNAKRRIDRPCVKLIPIENVRWDPSAEWCDPVGSSPYFLHLIPMYVKDVKARMKTIEADGQPKWRPMADNDLLKASAMYSDVVRLQREQGRSDPRQAQGSITDYTIVWVHRNIVDVDGGDFVYHTLGTLDLLDKPRPIQKAYFHGTRPYVVGFSVIETHKQYPSGPVRLGSQIQAELNENANQRSDNVKFAMNKRYFVKRTANVDLRSLQRNVPSSTTMMNNPKDGEDVRIVDTPDVTQSAYEEQDRLNLDFDDLMGSFSQASVATNRKLNETVGGMNILTKDASQITGYQLRTFSETWMEPVLRQLVLLEQRYESDEIILALAAKKAQLFQRFGMDTVTDELLLQQLTVKVNVGTGATNPHDQLQNFLLGMGKLRELLGDGVLLRYGADVGEIITEIFGKLGYKDGKRFFPGDDDKRFAAMQAAIDQLQQALDAKHPPEIVQATVKKLLAEVDKLRAEKVKVGVETEYSAIQTGEVLTAVPTVGPVGDKVLEAAGWQRPTPPGIDPNLPAGPIESLGLGIEAVKNKRTGISFKPGVGGIAAGNTNPSLPMPTASPASPGAGVAHGIETQRADGVPTGAGT